MTRHEKKGFLIRCWFGNHTIQVIIYILTFRLCLLQMRLKQKKWIYMSGPDLSSSYYFLLTLFLNGETYKSSIYSWSSIEGILDNLKPRYVSDGTKDRKNSGCMYKCRLLSTCIILMHREPSIYSAKKEIQAYKRQETSSNKYKKQFKYWPDMKFFGVFGGLCKNRFFIPTKVFWTYMKCFGVFLAKSRSKIGNCNQSEWTTLCPVISLIPITLSLLFGPF